MPIDFKIYNLKRFVVYPLIITFSVSIYVLPRLLESSSLVSDVLIAEDGIFINCFNNKRMFDCLVEGYRGWLHLPSMIIAALVYQFPLGSWAIINFFVHIILLALFVFWTYWSLTQVLKSRRDSLLLTFIVYSNPIIQI